MIKQGYWSPGDVYLEMNNGALTLYNLGVYANIETDINEYGLPSYSLDVTKIKYRAKVWEGKGAEPTAGEIRTAVEEYVYENTHYNDWSF